MNILVLGSKTTELASIQQALAGKKHTLIPVDTSLQAWDYIQSGEANFLIANFESSDIKNSGLVSRIRTSTLSQTIYILLLISKSDDELPPNGVDDVIQLPIKVVDLKNRITIAERIISLTSSLSLAREQLDNQAVYDALTGFITHAAFTRQATAELERSRRAILPFSLIAFDVDNFQEINQQYGNVTGDEVLKIVAKTIREKSRPYDCIGRWAGDEFLLALPNILGADAEKISDRIIAGVRATRIQVKSEAILNVKISAGVASVARITTSSDIESIIEKARQAMLRAKEAGGNQVFLMYS